MTQRIDLYRDELRPTESRPELPRHLALVGLAVLLMLLWGGYQQWQAAVSSARLVALLAEQERIQIEMTAASAAVAARTPDAALTAALLEAQFAVDGRRWVLEQLVRPEEEGLPLSSILEGLGRQRPEALWLTRIRVADHGAVLGLSGKMLYPEAVPLFMQRLAAERGLAGREFNHFRMYRPEAERAPLGFVMATDCQALPEGCDRAETAGAPP